jgi:hypothetical protein
MDGKLVMPYRYCHAPKQLQPKQLEPKSTSMVLTAAFLSLALFIWSATSFNSLLKGSLLPSSAFVAAAPASEARPKISSISLRFFLPFDAGLGFTMAFSGGTPEFGMELDPPPFAFFCPGFCPLPICPRALIVGIAEGGTFCRAVAHAHTKQGCMWSTSVIRVTSLLVRSVSRYSP